MKRWEAGCECVFGLPGYGKSTLSLRLIREHQKRGGAFAFVHDGFNRFPRARDVVEHFSLESCRSSWFENPKAIHVVACDDGIELLKFCIEVARRTRRPVVWWADEVVWVDGANNNSPKLAPVLKRLNATRRHDQVHIGLCSQSPVWAHKDLRRIASAIHCLRLEEKDDLKALRDSGVPTRHTQAIARLPPFKFVSYRR